MGGMKDTLGDQLYGSLYPQTPGWKEPTTSREAARAIAPNARELSARVLRQIKQSPAGMTADEIATAISVDRLAVRPRVSELREHGNIVATARRRKNVGGRNAIVWIDKARATP